VSAPGIRCSVFYDLYNIVIVKVTVKPDLDVLVRLSFPPGSLMDAAGNTLPSGIYAEARYQSPRPSEAEENALCIARHRKVEAIGQAWTVITASSILLSFTASIGDACTRPFVSLVVAVSSALDGDSNPGSMKLLTYSQKIYMTGRLGASVMPTTYRNFTERFDWSMLATDFSTVHVHSLLPMLDSASRGWPATMMAMRMKIKTTNISYA